MFKTFVIYFFLLFTHSCFGVEAKISRDFVVKAKSSDIAAWVKKNNEALINDSGIVVLNRNKDRIRIRFVTPFGPYEITLRESEEKKNEVYF